jgi:hypothetical protein
MPTQKMMPMPIVQTLSPILGSIAATTAPSGVTIIPSGSPLTRLNYFDGKFLRAADLQTEQGYLRTLIEFSNQAGGPGVANGFSAELQSGTQILLGSGLAIDPQGQVLLLTGAQTLNIPDLLPNASTQLRSALQSAAGAAFADCVAATSDPGSGVVNPTNLYLLCIAHAEAFCGEEDVYGKLCQEACVTSTDRPYVIEGIVVRLMPLILTTPLPVSSAVTLAAQHLRSRVASAYFEDERNVTGSLISKAGLSSDAWCLGADGPRGICVPLGVLGWTGSAASFFDALTSRRERMDPPARRYWQWRMRMRPWDVFMAQVLQFQCQLRDGLESGPQGGTTDPCQETRGLVGEASAAISELNRYYQVASQKLILARVDTTNANINITGGAAYVSGLLQRLSEAQQAAVIQTLDRLLIRQGIIEIPSAGYLPVTPGDAMTVNQQVRQWMGEGVDLRFCIVTPDYVQHALEEAQHMERISLIAGLDDPKNMPNVDILVPNGIVVQEKPKAGTAYQANLVSADLQFRGAAYIDAPQTGKVQIFTAADLENSANLRGLTPNLAATVDPVMMRAVRSVLFGDSSKAAAPGATAVTESFNEWLATTCDPNPFSSTSSGQSLVEFRAVGAEFINNIVVASDILLNGTLQFEQPVVSGYNTLLSGTFTGTLSTLIYGSGKSQDKTSRISLEVRALLSTPPNQDPGLQVVLINRSAQLTFDLSVTWSGTPRQIVAKLVRTSTDNSAPAPVAMSTTLGTGSFLQDDNVVQPTNPWHVEALKALDKIGQAINDQQFEPQSSTLLFPPLPPPSNDLQVQATLDWVLFQRRRTKQCHPDVIVTPVPSRRYQLWHGLLNNVDSLKPTLDALHSNAHFNKDFVAFQRVDVPEFAPGIVTLLTLRNTIDTDWTNIKTGPNVLYGAIASTDAAKQDGDSLALGRLKELELAIEPISPPTAGATSEVLPTIHPDLAVPGVDGIIVLLTQIEKVNHFVYEVATQDFLQELVKVVTPPGSTIPLQTELARVNGRLVGEVTFALKTTDVLNDTLTPVVTNWKALDFPDPIDARTFSVQGEAADLVASRVDQGTAILAALGPTHPVTSQSALAALALGPNLNPTVTVIVPGAPILIENPNPAIAHPAPAAAQPRVARLVPWQGNQSNRTVIAAPSPLLVRFAANGTLTGGVPPDDLSALRKVGKFGQVELATAETSPDADARKRMDLIADELVTAKLLPAGAARNLTKLRAKEKPLLTEGGIDATEIVFLRLG